MPDTEKIVATADEMRAMVKIVTDLVRERNALKRQIAELRETGRKVCRLALDAADVIADHGEDPEEIEEERDRINRLGEIFARGRRHR